MIFDIILQMYYTSTRLLIHVCKSNTVKYLTILSKKYIINTFSPLNVVKTLFLDFWSVVVYTIYFLFALNLVVKSL